MIKNLVLHDETGTPDGWGNEKEDMEKRKGWEIGKAWGKVRNGWGKGKKGMRKRKERDEEKKKVRKGWGKERKG